MTQPETNTPNNPFLPPRPEFPVWDGDEDKFLDGLFKFFSQANPPAAAKLQEMVQEHGREKVKQVLAAGIECGAGLAKPEFINLYRADPERGKEEIARQMLKESISLRRTEAR